MVQRYENSGVLSELQEGINALLHANRLIPDNHHMKSACLNDLGTSFQVLFDRSGDIADLHQAIMAQQQALTLTPDGHPHKLARLSNLGLSFGKRFKRLGNVADLDEAITIQQRVIRVIPGDHSDKPACLNDLGLSFQSRFQRFGDITDLDEAITAQQEGVRITPSNHPRKPGCLHNLGNSFRIRFERFGDVADLNEAITAQQEAVRLTQDGHPDKPAHLSNLGVFFQCRFDRLGDVADLDEAVTAGQQALRLVPDGHPAKPACLSYLGNSLLRRVECLGNVADLDEAIKSHQLAVRLIPDGHPDKPEYLNNLSVSLRSQFECLGDIVHLDDAIMAQQHAVRLTPDGHPRKPARLSSLGMCFLTRLKRHHDDATVAQATSSFSQSAKSSSGRPSTRFMSARRWAALCSQFRSDGTLNAYSTLIDLIPRVVWLGRTVEQRHQDISSIGNAVAEAAAAAVALGEPNLALEWLEQGRSIVWGQILQLRTPLSNLRKRHPHEADRLEKISRALESVGTDQSLTQLIPSSAGTSQTLEEAAQAHRRLAQEYERLVEHIRTFPDFGEFLLPPKSATLCSAAVSGPIVLVNLHEDRCDALILLPDSSYVSHVPLPALQASNVSKMWGKLGGLTRGQRACGPFEAAPLLKWDEEMPDLLAQLWVCIAEPILRYLKVGFSYYTGSHIHDTDCKRRCLKSLRRAKCLTLHGV